jgi:hypothetical protein
MTSVKGRFVYEGMKHEALDHSPQQPGQHQGDGERRQR